MGILLITIGIVICYISTLIYLYFNPYIDEIVDEGDITKRIGGQWRVHGGWRLYKRTYKNGQVVFHEKKYKA